MRGSAWLLGRRPRQLVGLVVTGTLLWAALTIYWNSSVRNNEETVKSLNSIRKDGPLVQQSYSELHVANTLKKRHHEKVVTLPPSNVELDQIKITEIEKSLKDPRRNGDKKLPPAAPPAVPPAAPPLPPPAIPLTAAPHKLRSTSSPPQLEDVLQALRRRKVAFTLRDLDKHLTKLLDALPAAWLLQQQLRQLLMRQACLNNDNNNPNSNDIISNHRNKNEPNSSYNNSNDPNGNYYNNGSNPKSDNHKGNYPNNNIPRINNPNINHLNGNDLNKNNNRGNPADASSNHINNSSNRNHINNSSNRNSNNKTLNAASIMAAVAEARTNMTWQHRRPGKSSRWASDGHRSTKDIVSSSSLLDHLLVDDIHKLVYCYVPKTACTQWRKVLMVLLKTTGRKMEDIRHHPAHDKKKIPNLADHTAFTVYKVLGEYKKVLVSRPPLERLLSAYLSKFDASTKEALSFTNAYSKHWLQRVRGENSSDAGKITFKEMLKYLTGCFEPESSFDEHWRPVYHLCHPCTIRYDYVVDFANLEYDSNRVLQELQRGSSGNVTFPPAFRSRTPEKLDLYMQQLDPKLVEKVRKLYQWDFKMFE